MVKKNSLDEIIEKSGNGFHYRCVEHLRSLGWEVRVSPHYSDINSEKTREIDIVAQKKYPANAYFGDNLGSIEVQLFIECKYSPHDTIFWFDKKNKEKAIERIHLDAKLPDPRTNTAMENHHYYIADSVAKLFSSGKNEEREDFNKAVGQTLNAVIFYRNKPQLFSRTSYEKIVRRVCYPMIFVNSFDHFHKIRVSRADEPENKPEKITSPFLYETDYAYMDGSEGRGEYFLVDVVALDHASEFLKTIENSDIRAINSHVSWEIGHQQRQIEENRQNRWRNSAM